MGGKTGPRNKPTALKIIDGTLRRSTVNEAKPARELPECPEFLDGYAKFKWGVLAEKLFALGLLSAFDGDALGCYCQAYARWRHAEEALADFVKADPRFRGLVIRTAPKGEGKGGGNTIQNPLVGIANKAMADMMRYAIEFGLTPSARARINVDAAQAGEADPSDKYFRKRA